MMTRFLPRFLSRHSLGQRFLWMGPAVLMVLAVLLMVGAPPAQAQEKMSEQEKQMLAQLQEMNQADGYLEAHRNVKQPLELLGGPLSFTIRQSSGGVFVSLPDHRTLDPDVFGTPEQPLALIPRRSPAALPEACWASIRWTCLAARSVRVTGMVPSSSCRRGRTAAPLF